MSEPQTTEGYAEFSVPAAGEPCKTWYSISGNLRSGVTPLVALHGGPGAPGRYLKPLYALSSSHNIPVVLYDQLGNGNSTHLPSQNGKTSFWTVQLFLDELSNLLTHLGIQDNYDLLGHSWGGMLAATHAALQPKGLRRLILADSPARAGLWAESARKLRGGMSEDVQEKFRRGEEEGKYEGESGRRRIWRIWMEPWPAELNETMEWLVKNPSVCMTMFGPSDVNITGSLKDWSIVNEAHKITVPTLLVHGRHDTAQDETMQPYFDRIQKVKWVTFSESSHMPQLEERERYLQVVGDFLKAE